MSASEPKVVKSEQEWREQLTPAQYDVLRKAGTEPPFTGEYVYNKESGDYRCAACGAVLFSADTKFDSGTGWPSFTEPAVAEAVELRPDNSLFMRRTEVALPHLRRAPGARLRRRARARPASATASTRRRCRSSPRSSLPAAMIMFEQSRRLSEPLRWGRREKTVVAVLLSCVALALIGLGAYALTSGAPARRDCIDLTFASTLGVARVHAVRRPGEDPVRGAEPEPRVRAGTRRRSAGASDIRAPRHAPRADAASRQMSKPPGQVLARMALPAFPHAGFHTGTVIGERRPCCADGRPQSQTT